MRGSVEGTHYTILNQSPLTVYVGPCANYLIGQLVLYVVSSWWCVKDEFLTLMKIRLQITLQVERLET